MQKAITLFICLIIWAQSSVFAQTEKLIKPVFTKVVLFTNGAQMESEANFDMETGKITLNATGLSPYIKKESIRIDGDGNYTILNVQHKIDYVNELDKDKISNEINTKIIELKNKIENEELAIKIIADKLDFLKTNKNISGNDQAVNPDVFKTMNLIYGENIEKLSLETLAKQRLIKGYSKDIEKYTNELNTLNSKASLPSGTIQISIEAKATRRAKMQITYLVDHAEWYPSYDVRFSSANKPLSFSYKANIYQSTGIDWQNVKLVLSTAKTDISAQMPTFQAQYLQFFVPNYTGNVSDMRQGRVSGLDISSSSGAPGTGSNIRIRGLSSVNSAKPLIVVDGVPYEGNTDDFDYGNSDVDQFGNLVGVSPEDIERIEVLKDASATAVYGSRGNNGVLMITTKKQARRNSTQTTNMEKHETSNEYVLATPQSILSNSKLNVLNFKETDINASYEFQSIPKLSENVFLIGRINDWASADLLDGEMNVYIGNSFVGTSEIKTQQFKDTLEISFGVDNNITIKREKLKEFIENKFIGSNRKETVAWKIKIRNNKSTPVLARIYDQIPISNNNDITVETLELSKGKIDNDNGKIEWNISLNANETKEIILKYSVKYPKDKQVVID